MVAALHGEFGVFSDGKLEAHLLREEPPDGAVHVLVGTMLPSQR